MDRETSFCIDLGICQRSVPRDWILRFKLKSVKTPTHSKDLLPPLTDYRVVFVIGILF